MNSSLSFVDDSKVPDWETLSLALMYIFLITILTLIGVSVSRKLRPELWMIERNLSHTLLASILGKAEAGYFFCSRRLIGYYGGNDIAKTTKTT